MKIKQLILITICVVAVGCGLFGGSYSETFDNQRSWGVQQNESVTGAVVDERFELSVILPDSMFWTTAGRRGMESGTFGVDVEPLSGSREAGYGLVFRVSPDARDFYFFLISSDGYYSIGACENACQEQQDVIAFTPHLWMQSDVLGETVEETHALRVVADGNRLTYFIDDQEVGAFDDDRFESGDVGFLLQTFDSAATVAYDNLSYTPPEE